MVKALDLKSNGFAHASSNLVLTDFIFSFLPPPFSFVPLRAIESVLVRMSGMTLYLVSLVQHFTEPRQQARASKTGDVIRHEG